MSFALFLAAISLISSPYFTFRFRTLSGFLLNVVLLAAGCQLRFVHQDSPLQNRVSPDASQRLIVEVKKAPERKGKSVSCLVTIRWRIKSGRCVAEREDLLVYFRDTIIPTGWTSGCMRLLEARLTPVRNRVWPTATARPSFDYEAWCGRRHLYSRAFVNPAGTAFLGWAQSPGLQQTLSRLQERLRLICRLYVPSPARGGLLEALLIGYTKDLDPEVMRSYSDAGVVHIIAISGLHLALIAEVLQMTLSILGSARVMRWLRLFLLLAVIWGYSLLTGASPSVLRSALMFSVVLLARHFSVQAPVYNALAASAFLLLCDDPNRLWDTGFQLSYAAVLSLVLFAGPIGKWVNPTNKLLSALWKATSVSLAAQVLTTPVSIWYFHRFPFYFLLSNLVAVPLSSAILLGGIGLLTISSFPAFATPLSIFLDKALGVMNDFVAYSNRLPGAAATAIPIHLLQVILCYSMLYCACRFAERAEKRWLFFLLLQACVFLVDGLNC